MSEHIHLGRSWSRCLICQQINTERKTAELEGLMLIESLAKLNQPSLFDIEPL